MIDLDREMRALLDEDVRGAPPLPVAGPVLRRAHRRQTVVALTSVVTFTVVAIASVMALSGMLRSSEPVPVEPPDTLMPGTLEAIVTGTTGFEGLVVADDGTVWGAGAGLSRFDPTTGELRSFTLADDPAFGNIWVQAPARDGGVWVASGDSVRRFDGEAFREALPYGPYGSVWEIAEGPDGTIWGTGGEGLSRWEGASWVPVPSEGLWLQGTLAVDPDGNVWVANIRYPGPDAFGIARFDGTSWTSWTTRDGLPSDDVYTIVPGPSGEVWIGTANGVARFRDGSWTAYPRDVSGVQHVISLAVLEETVLIGGREGGEDASVARFDGSSWTEATADDGLEGTGSVAVEVATGPSGAWAVTGAGLFRMEGSRWQLVVPAGTGLPTERVSSIAAIDEDTVWVVTGDGGVWLFDGGTWTRAGTEDGLPSDQVNDIMVADDGSVWAATRRGLARFDGTRWEEVASGDRGAVAVAPTGTVWSAEAAGSSPTSGWIVGPVGGTPIAEPAPVDLDGPSALVVRAADDVWIGGAGSWLAGGLAHFDGDRWTTFDRKTITPEFPGDPNCSGFTTCNRVPVDDIVSTPDGDLWVVLSVWAGRSDPSFAISRFDGRSWRTTYRDAFGSMFVPSWPLAPGGLDVSGFGRMLFATGGGLFELRDGTWRLVQEGDFGAVSEASDGTVWLAGDRLYRLPAR